MPVPHPPVMRSKLARVLGTTVQSNGTPPPEDPVQRAVAEQVDELLVWDRAVRADAYDSVHQMRVTTRKIRSLLRTPQESLGLSDGASPGCSTNCASSPVSWVWPAMPRCSRERYEQELDRLSPELVRGPVRERLVEGAQRRYQTGLRRSLIAMRSQRYFRLLDALDCDRGRKPRHRFRRGSDVGHHRRRLQEGAQGRKGRRPSGASRTRIADSRRAEDDEDHDLEQDRDEALHRFASAPSDFATPRRPPARTTCPSRPRPSRRCSAIIKTAWSAVNTWLSRPTPPRRRRGHLHLRSALPAGGRPGRQLPSAARRGAAQTRQVGAQSAPDACPAGRASWPVSRILFPTAAA